MIEIRKSPTADTRTCDFKKVTREELYKASSQHIDDVRQGLVFFVDRIYEAATHHDPDKLSDIAGFHRDFINGFDGNHQTWWTAHRLQNRHHLTHEDGIPADVNLIDVLDYITDCVMAGMARSGEVYTIPISHELLMRAFVNTIEILMKNVRVVE